MPRLKEVVAEDLTAPAHRAGEAFALRDVEVVAVKLGTGSPCSRHGELFEPWPGPHEHVHKWFVLANDKAVGVDEHPVRGPSLVVTDYDR